MNIYCKRKKNISVLVLAFIIMSILSANAQTSRKNSANSSQSANTQSGGGTTQNGSPSATGGGEQQKTPATSKSSIKNYDPFLDNHLKAPPDGINVGKFGMKIKEVEHQLSLIGAKHQSYAFGRHSTMVFSSYLITMSFNIEKRLGLVSILPKKPLETVEPKARDFFIKFFTEGADLSQVAIIVESNKLEMKFVNPND